LVTDLFSVAPDGKSLLCTVEKNRNDLWLLQGYRPPGLWNRIKDALHLNRFHEPLLRSQGAVAIAVDLQ